MKIYIIETSALIATISRIKYDWLLEIETKCGGELVGTYRSYFLTQKSCIAEFQRFREKGFLIKTNVSEIPTHH
jgi:hypothetical protein